jgi:thymidine kinase
MAKMIFEYSVMNAGKTTNLLGINFNYLSIGKKTLLVKSVLDKRETEIVSRIGIKADCISIKEKDNTYELFKNEDVTAILVDEAQFLTKEQVLGFRKLVDCENISVICFGLKTNFKGDLFEGSATLLARADKLIENKTLCHCSAKATMVLKFDEETGVVFKTGVEIEAGSEDKYVSVCHYHWENNDTGKNNN